MNMISDRKYTEEELIMKTSEFFKALSDFSRLKIIKTLLKNKEQNVSSLCKDVTMSQTAVSNQLKTLKEVNLVKTRREGKSIYYSIKDEHVEEIMNLTFIHLEEKHNED